MFKRIIVYLFLLFTLSFAQSNGDNVLLLNGDGDYVKLPVPIINSNAFTIEAFAYMHAKGGGYYRQNPLFQQRDDATENNNGKSAIIFCSDMQYNQTYLAVRDDELNTSRLTCPAPDFGEWNHYAVVVNQNMMYLYINGELKDSCTRNAPGSLLTSIDYIDIGRSRSNQIDTGFFNGMINEMRIWDNALSNSQVQNLSTNVIASQQMEITNAVGLAAYWDFNEINYVINNNGELERYVVDKSGNENDGLMINNASLIPNTSEIQDSKIMFPTVPFMQGTTVTTPLYINIANHESMNIFRIRLEGFLGKAELANIILNPLMVNIPKTTLEHYFMDQELVIKVKSSTNLGMNGNLLELEWNIIQPESGIIPLKVTKCKINSQVEPVTFIAGGIYIPEGNITNPVTLANLNAVYQPDKSILVEWQTHSETNNLGFNVYTSATQTGPWEKVNDQLIYGAGTTVEKHKYEFVDNTLINSDSKYYKIEQLDTDGSSTVYGPIELDGILPTQYNLEQNYPNPFNPVTTISYTLPTRGNVKISVFNIRGELIKTLVNTSQQAGSYEIQWDATSNYGNTVSTGVYLVRMDAGSYTKIQKMVFAK